ncbi:putative reverse transcriptase domain-containing protein [Tanacetum coccineum]
MQQRRWIELFSDYDCQIRYHPGKANVVADALSGKERVKPKRFRAMNMTLQSSIKDRILGAQKEAYNESMGLQKGLYEMIEHRSDEALYYLDRIWVPLKGDVRTLIMDKAHKSKYSVHPGSDKTYYDIRDRYWCSGMKKDIAVYVSRCLTCLKVKAEHQRLSGLLQQPEIPEWKWEGIAMDLVTKLPRTSSGHDTIWVIVERLTKYAHFLPMREDYKMDRFWQSMQKALETHLDMSTAYHPQIDGQIMFSYNNSYHSSVRCTPFEALYSRKCRSPIMWAKVGEGQLIGPDLVQETTEKILQIKDRLKATHDRQKSYVDNRRKPLEFGVGDHIVEKVGFVAYRLRLPKELNGVHDTFHMSNLKKCLADPTLQVPLDEIQVDAKLNFVEEPVEILKREFKKLKRSTIAIVKVRWNSKRGPEFTLEREDQMRHKSCSDVVAFACVILRLLLEVALCKCSSTGRPLGAYNLGVTTLRALVYASLMTSRDAKSWYMISGDAKSWVYLHIFTVILHNCEENDRLWYPKDSGFELTAFSDVDHARCIDTSRSTSGVLQFLGLRKKYRLNLKNDMPPRDKKVFNWENAKYGKIWYDEDVHDLRFMETEFPTIVFNDNLSSNETLSYEPTVSSLNNNEINFRISYDESDDEDYTVIFDKNSFSYKIIYTNDLKMDSENDNEKVSMPLFPSPKPSVSCIDDLDFFKDFENEFPAIVYNDPLTSKSDFSTEPTLCPQHIDKIDFKDETSLSEYDEVEQNILYFNDLFPFNIIYFDDLKSDKDNDDNEIDMIQSLGALPPRYQRHQYLRYEGLQYTNVDIADFEMRLARIYKREVHRRIFNIRGPLVHKLILKCFSTFRFGEAVLDLDTTAGFDLYWAESARQIPNKGDLRDYWIGISSTGDFLGTTPSYTSIRDLTLRMCHRLITCSIEGRSQAPEKVTVTDLFYLRGMDIGSFVARLAEHFGLLTEERLQGLIVIDATIDDEGVMAVPAPVQAPQPPPPAAGPAWTMAQRLARVEEDVHEIRKALVGLGSGTPAMQTFRSRMRGIPDAGLTDLAERKEIDNVGEESTIWKFGSVGVLKPQDGCSTRILTQ